MSLDEERRAIEREARYSQNLTNFLTCMRDGHDPIPGTRNLLPEIAPGRLREKLHCARCRLGYWDDRRCACGHSWENHGPSVDPGGPCMSAACGCTSFQPTFEPPPSVSVAGGTGGTGTGVDLPAVLLQASALAGQGSFAQAMALLMRYRGHPDADAAQARVQGQQQAALLEFVRLQERVDRQAASGMGLGPVPFPPGSAEAERVREILAAEFPELAATLRLDRTGRARFGPRPSEQAARLEDVVRGVVHPEFAPLVGTGRISSRANPDDSSPNVAATPRQATRQEQACPVCGRVPACSQDCR
jgi:hypothetical protein